MNDWSAYERVVREAAAAALQTDRSRDFFLDNCATAYDAATRRSTGAPGDRVRVPRMTQQDIQSTQEHLLKVTNQAIDLASTILTANPTPENVRAAAALLDASATAFSSVAIGPVDPPDAA